jgi:phosphatidate cytidylyltransferase
MDNDDRRDDPTESWDMRIPGFDADDADAYAPDDVEPDDDPWSELGAGRGPRQPAEGVRIIGADEAAAAIESGSVASKMPEDAPRFGDVPPQPAGPRPSLRFPGVDPTSVDKPPVAGEPLPPQERPSAADDPARPWDELLARSAERRRAGSSGGSGLFPEDSGGWFRSEPTASPPRPEMPERPAPSTLGSSFGQSWFDDDDDFESARERPSATVEPPSGSTPLPHWTEPPSGEVPRILPEADDAEPEPVDDDLTAWSSLSTGPRWRDQPTDWEEADFDDAILADEGPRVGALRATPEDSGPFSFDDLDVEPEPEPPPLAIPPPSDGRTARPPVPPGGRARISTLPTSTGGPIGPPGLRGAPGGADERSDLSSRILTGAIAGGVVLVAAAIGPSALVFLVAVALTMASAELFHALRTRGYQPATLLGLVGTASLVGAVYWRGLDAYPLVIGLFVVFTLLWYLTGVVRAHPTINIAVTLMAFLYVSFLGSFAALILKAGSAGIRILIGAILATVAYDIGAFFVGRWAGKTPLAPSISPHKTVEGLVGASLATLLTCLVIVRAIDPWDGGKAFWLAVVVSIAAPLGDLCESMIKRDLDVKDMGALLPGHGGILDRIDALIFVIPATYYLVRLIFF